MRERDAYLAAAAARQHGVVTRCQLLQAGFTPSAVTRRVESGRLQLLHRGVYLTVPFALARTREMAAVLASGAGAVLSHINAVAFWEARDPVNGPVEVTVVHNGGRRPGIRVHRVQRLDEDEWTVHEGIPVTTPARTLLDVAGEVDIRELEAMVARAERTALVRREELSVMLARHAGHAGAQALRAVLERPGGPALTRSVAEARLLELVRQAGLPPPECNVSIGRYEIDLLWRSARLAVEVDGFRYHSSRPRFEGDRRKDTELVAAGFTVLRLSWRQVVEEPLPTVARLRRRWPARATGRPGDDASRGEVAARGASGSVQLAASPRRAGRGSMRPTASPREARERETARRRLQRAGSAATVTRS